MKRKSLATVGGVLASLTILGFGLSLFSSNVEQNVVTWIMWAILDVLVLSSSLAAGSKGSWLLPAGYTAGATLTALVLVRKGVWAWGDVESLCAIGVAVSVLIWRAVGPKWAIVALTVAMTIAGIPEAYHEYVSPQPASWWLWAIVAFSCALTALSTKEWTIKERFFPIASLIWNGMMTILVLR
ncbi:MAG TPA: hypothetical protein VJG48_00055 [Candidatus Paceibacterota bacterium]